MHEWNNFLNVAIEDVDILEFKELCDKDRVFATFIPPNLYKPESLEGIKIGKKYMGTVIVDRPRDMIQASAIAEARDLGEVVSGLYRIVIP